MGATTTIGIARSDEPNWKSTYTTLPVSYPQFRLHKSSEVVELHFEDPFIWYHTASGSFHALFHGVATEEHPDSSCLQVGCHAFSEDGYTWYLASSDPYDFNLHWTDGTGATLTKKVARRERPHLVFNSAGDPAFLSNGVQDVFGVDRTYTYVSAINAPFP